MSSYRYPMPQVYHSWFRVKTRHCPVRTYVFPRACQGVAVLLRFLKHSAQAVHGSCALRTQLCCRQYTRPSYQRKTIVSDKGLPACISYRSRGPEAYMRPSSNRLCLYDQRPLVPIENHNLKCNKRISLSAKSLPRSNARYTKVSRTKDALKVMQASA